MKRFTQGKAYVDGTIYIGSPGSNSTIQVTSEALDANLLNKVLGIKNPNFELMIEFRLCESGEVTEGGECTICPFEKFSLEVPA